MSREVLHVVPHNQEWAVKREGNERASSTHGTQKEAIEAARELAKERDDIVIHRPDGTIRERVTYMGSNNGSQESASTTPQGIRGNTREGDTRQTVGPSDLFSVGSRVSWAAVAAGVAVALAMYITLSLLAVAVGVSTIDQVGSQTFRIGAAIVSAVILLGSMFLGGYVVSRTTAGEQPGEAVAYGTIMWGTAVMLLLTAGVSTGAGYLSGMRQFGTPTPTVDTARMTSELNLTPAQAERYAAVTRDSQAVSDRASPQSIAWWTFGGVALSLLAAMAGSYFGAGPEFALRGVRRTDGVPATPGTRVEPRPA